MIQTFMKCSNNKTKITHITILLIMLIELSKYLIKKIIIAYNNVNKKMYKFKLTNKKK